MSQKDPVQNVEQPSTSKKIKSTEAAITSACISCSEFELTPKPKMICIHASQSQQFARKVQKTPNLMQSPEMECTDRTWSVIYIGNQYTNSENDIHLNLN